MILVNAKKTRREKLKGWPAVLVKGGVGKRPSIVQEDDWSNEVSSSLGGTPKRKCSVAHLTRYSFLK